MAVTLRELLSDAQHKLAQSSGDTRAAARDAVAVFSQIARACDQLDRSRLNDKNASLTSPPDVVILRNAAREASRCWPDARSPIADVVSVAADVIATRMPALDERQRWAISIELAETARRAVDTARQFPPYANVPHLAAVRTAAVACEQRAARVPDAIDATSLDRLVPGAAHTGGLEAVVNAAAALYAAAGRQPRDRWTVAEVIITVNAAHVATAYAAAYAIRLSGEPMTRRLDRPALAAPEAWAAARILCRPFDDGTKLRPPADSVICSSAARLGRTLLDQLASAHTTQSTTTHVGGDLERAGTLLTVATLLPDIATALQGALYGFADTRQLWGNERSLRASEDREDLAAILGRIGVPEHRDLERLVTAVATARTLTDALALDLSASAHVRLPDLTARIAARSATSLSVWTAAHSAHDAVRHVQLATNEEWVMARALRPGGPRGR